MLHTQLLSLFKKSINCLYIRLLWERIKKSSKRFAFNKRILFRSEISSVLFSPRKQIRGGVGELTVSGKLEKITSLS